MIELNIPAAAEQDPASIEVLRVWVANKGQHGTLRTGLWRDPAAWGIVLADPLRHFANAHQQETGFKFDETVSTIRDLFDRGLSSPTVF